MSNRIRQILNDRRLKSIQANIRTIYDESLTRKAVQALRERWRAPSPWLEEGSHPSGRDAFSSNRSIRLLHRFWEVFSPTLLVGWRSSKLRGLVASFAKDFSARPVSVSGLFFSSYLLSHTLLFPGEGWTLGKGVAKVLLISLPLMGLWVKVDLKGLLGSSLISKAWGITSRFSDGPSATLPRPGLSKPPLSLRKDTR